MLFHLGVWCLSVSPECMVFELEPVVSTVRNLTPSFQRIFISVCVYFFYGLTLIIMIISLNWYFYSSSCVFILCFSVIA